MSYQADVLRLSRTEMIEDHNFLDRFTKVPWEGKPSNQRSLFVFRELQCLKYT
jgi:hypothetical protein